MIRIFIVAAAMVFAFAGPSYADKASPEAKAGVTKALADMGCTVDESDIDADDGAYEADDVECKDGNYDMTLDKDFKVTNKKKED